MLTGVREFPQDSCMCPPRPGLLSACSVSPAAWRTTLLPGPLWEWRACCRMAPSLQPNLLAGSFIHSEVIFGASIFCQVLYLGMILFNPLDNLKCRLCCPYFTDKKTEARRYREIKWAHSQRWLNISANCFVRFCLCSLFLLT